MAETIIYLDHAATTPLHPEVLEAMLPWLQEGYGNPGSLHRVGRRARQAVKIAREQVAALIGAEAHEICFTSGGTEANNLALAGSVAARGGRILTSAIEHHAVLHAAHRWSQPDSLPVVFSVDGQGLVDPSQISEALSPEIAIVSIMYGNNETGVIQPVDEIAASCHAAGVPYHCDAVQAAGHVPLDVASWPVDLLSLSAHKLGGPKGVGALYIRRDTPLNAHIVGGGQEQNRRAGTENVAGIAGFGKACQLARENMELSSSRLLGLRARLEDGVRARVPEVWVNSGQANRLPHISNIGVAHVAGEGILYGLDAEGICISTGSACTSGVADPSHVLRAMGQADDVALGAFRISLGFNTTEADIDRILNVLPRVIQELRTH